MSPTTGTPTLKMLFYSDLHLSLGPRDSIRPEMRKLWCKLGYCGETVMDQFEDRLRMESKRVQRMTHAWLNRHSDEYDLLVNGGDLALPLGNPEDRLGAARLIWSHELERYGEHRYLTLTGNHEIGHGYDPDPGSYEGLMKLREELFELPTNRLGYGKIEIEGVTLLLLDSELIAVSRLLPYEPFIREHLHAMSQLVYETIEKKQPVVILTHNTARLRRWMILAGGMWNQLLCGKRRVVMIGGHFHMPRRRRRAGAEIHWAGGASYPEPFLRYLTYVPFSGVLKGGAGGVEVILQSGGVAVIHRTFLHPKEPLVVHYA